MYILDRSIEKQRIKGFNHPSNQPGWVDSSPRPPKTPEEAKYLSDEEYHTSLGIHDPLWRYIIKSYTKESDAPLMVMSYDALPIAIELSQWTYPVIYVAETDKEIADVKRDTQRQAGFFKKIHKIDYKNYRGYFPLSRVAIFVGIIDKMNSNDAIKFIDNLLKSVREVVCSVKSDRNWKEILAKYKIDGINYYKNNWTLLKITKK